MKTPCVAQTGEPGQECECGQPCEFLLPIAAGSQGLYSGWYHIAEDGGAYRLEHHPIPKS